MRSSTRIIPIIVAAMQLIAVAAMAQQGAVTPPKLAGGNNVTAAQRGMNTGDVTVATDGCESTYLLGGSRFFTVTVPPADGFPMGCTIRLWNVDPMPAYVTSTFLGVIRNTTLVVYSGRGPTNVGQALTHAGILAGTTVTACPSTGCGSTGNYAISTPQTLSAATFTGSASGVRLSAISVSGTITVGDVISGTGVPSGTAITGQASGTPGGAGVYITNQPTSANASPITSTPKITFYGVSGGRGKAIVGLITKMLYPGQEIRITSLGKDGWAQPLIPPRWQLTPNYGQVRLFVSPTGKDTGNDGLGGCTDGMPFATVNALSIFLATEIDFRGDDPVTVQFCPGTYSPGSQQLHFPVDLPGRNGGAGVRFTGSPGPPQNCPSRSAVTIQASEGNDAIFETDLPYVWILLDCMTLTSPRAPVIEANRGSWIALSTGLAFAGSRSAAVPEILVLNGAHIILDSNTLLSVLGDGDAGQFMAVGNGSQFLNLGGHSSGVSWYDGPPKAVRYQSVFFAAQGSLINLGDATLSVDGSMNAYSIWADESWVSSEIPIPGAKGVRLTNGACISGLMNQCAKPSAGN